MKYKVGQRVRILPSAIGIGVASKEVGAIRKVVAVTGRETLDVETYPGRKFPWHVWTEHIEPYNVVGEQLLLWDDLMLGKNYENG